MAYRPHDIRALGACLQLLEELDDRFEAGRISSGRGYRLWIAACEDALGELDTLFQRNYEFRELRHTQPNLNQVLQNRLANPYGPWGQIPPTPRDAEDFVRQREELRRRGDPMAARLPRDWRRGAGDSGLRRRRRRHREPDELPRARTQDDLLHLEDLDVRDESPVREQDDDERLQRLYIHENAHLLDSPMLEANDEQPVALSEEDPRLPPPNTQHPEPINLVDEEGFAMHRFKPLLSNLAPGTDTLIRGKNVLAKTKRTPNKETPFYEVIKTAVDNGTFHWVNEGPRGAIWAIDKGSEDVWAALKEFNEGMKGEALPWELLGVGDGMCEGMLYVLKPLVESR